MMCKASNQRLLGNHHAARCGAVWLCNDMTENWVRFYRNAFYDVFAVGKTDSGTAVVASVRRN